MSNNNHDKSDSDGFVIKLETLAPIDNCTCEWVIYNNTYCRADELTKFELE